LLLWSLALTGGMGELFLPARHKHLPLLMRPRWVPARHWRLCRGLAAFIALWLADVWRRGPSALGFATPGSTLAKVIVTDVDGTLMDSSHKLPAANRLALRSCMERGMPVVLATGKHCGPWVDALVAEVVGDGLQASSRWTLNAPGVFVQGLLVRDAKGDVVSKQALGSEVVGSCRDAANSRNWTVLAYTEDNRIISNRADPQTQRIEALGEPSVEVGRVDVAVLKMLFLARPEDEGTVRDEVAELVGREASITVAVTGMVEVLPLGASKADGVKVALDMLGVGAGDALSLGDGENDLELLQLVRGAGGMAVAVGTPGLC